MRKLYIVIGRSPNPANEAEGSLKWYIDIDLAPSKKVSPQHALIAYNFEKMWYAYLTHATCIASR